MRGLITDRTVVNTTRCIQLSKKGWGSMSDSEQALWSGNPLTAAQMGYESPVNLLPPIGEGVIFRNGSITSEAGGIVVIGNSSDFVGKTVTLSAEIVTSGGSLTLGWYTGSSFTSAGIILSAAGAVTETLGSSFGSKLAMKVTAGHYSKVMLEMGHAQSEYVPYYDILPTPITKGAYNYSDLNRVERAVAEIAEGLGLELETKTDWSIWDIPTEAEGYRYVGNIRKLQEYCGTTYILPYSLGNLSYLVANNIESVLRDAYKVVDSINRCGDIYCGEV